MEQVSRFSSFGLIFFVYMLTGTCIPFVLFRHWYYDDPFITFCYAQNLLNGLGFVYTPGERVLSTTTPLFAMILGFLGIFYPHSPRLAILLGSCSIVAGGWIIFLLGREFQAPLVGIFLPSEFGG